ncbi:MAG: hypothetical protein PHI90_02950 [Clostridia bacterium]|nr:hypothetical protein [Clostridia bacterium]MDD4047774.1 hypothetical protein [Clostridia bacterium]
MNTNTKIRNKVIALFVIIGFVLLLYFVFLHPQFVYKKNLVSEIANLDKEIQVIHTKSRNYQNVDSLIEKYNDTGTEVSIGSTSANIVRALINRSELNKINIDVISFVSTEEHNELLEKKVSLAFEGDYKNILSFIKSLEEYSCYAYLTSLRIIRESGVNIQGEMVITVITLQGDIISSFLK